MRKEKILTKQIAEKYLADSHSVDLSELTSIEDAAAELLAKHEGCLQLNGLTSLSGAAAAVLAKQKGYLELNGLTSLSDAAAASLARHKEHLSLDGITSLSDAAAESLAKNEGGLWLGSLTSLSDATAAAMAEHKGSLYLQSLTSLSDAAAESLAKHEGLSLNREAKEAIIAAKVRLAIGADNEDADTTSDGSILIKEIAEEFLEDTDSVELKEFTSIEDAAVEALAKHEGDIEVGGKTEEALRAAKVRADKLKNGTISWESSFLNSARERFKKSIFLKADYSSIEVLLNSAVSYGTSEADISKWLEDNGIFIGGDADCERNAELDWVVGPCNWAAEAIAAAVKESDAKEEAAEEGEEESADTTSDGNILTKEIAGKYLADSDSVDLLEFTSIEDAAAVALVKREKCLRLNGLTSLSDAAVAALARHEGTLWLRGLTNLSDAAAESLSKHEGELRLGGLKSLSDTAAGSLAKHKGGLWLRGQPKQVVRLARKHRAGEQEAKGRKP